MQEQKAVAVENFMEIKNQIQKIVKDTQSKEQVKKQNPNSTAMIRANRNSAILRNRHFVENVNDFVGGTAKRKKVIAAQAQLGLNRSVRFAKSANMVEHTQENADESVETIIAPAP